MDNENKVKFLDKFFKKTMELSDTETGEVHFRRWRIIETRWFNIYIHQINKSDTDELHNHPWNYVSMILSGGYFEKLYEPITKREEFSPYYPFTILRREWYLYHKISLIPEGYGLTGSEIPCWTIVFTGKRINPNWGYYLNKEQVICTNDTYRKIKKDKKAIDIIK